MIGRLAARRTVVSIYLSSGQYFRIAMLVDVHNAAAVRMLVYAAYVWAEVTPPTQSQHTPSPQRPVIWLAGDAAEEIHLAAGENDK
jgi:hypothetical protein